MFDKREQLRRTCVCTPKFFFSPFVPACMRTYTSLGVSFSLSLVLPASSFLLAPFQMSSPVGLFFASKKGLHIRLLSVKPRKSCGRCTGWAPGRDRKREEGLISLPFSSVSISNLLVFFANEEVERFFLSSSSSLLLWNQNSEKKYGICDRSRSRRRVAQTSRRFFLPSLQLSKSLEA